LEESGHAKLCDQNVNERERESEMDRWDGTEHGETLIQKYVKIPVIAYYMPLFSFLDGSR
jgi:hypothetical protein